MSILSWAHRRAPDASAQHLFDRLRHGSDAGAAAATGLPEHWVHGVRSFYDLLRPSGGPLVCAGTGCLFEGGALDPGERGAQCLGRCYEAPSRSDRPPTHIPRRSLVAEPIVLRHLLGPTDPTLDYDLPSGDQILGAVIASGLRGRGGAAFPTGLKWRSARDTPAEDRVVVCNGDEGDPGSYVDRLLLEESPHAVIAGMVACARTIGARRGIVFVRGEYPLAADRVEAAVTEAEGLGLLGPLTIRVLRGAGSYVAGEETALLRAIEGLRAEASPKPPYPSERGLYGLPTVVQNVETLSVVPWVARHDRKGDTKAICLAGAVAEPGVVEIPLGMPLREVLERGGGGPAPGRRWKMALVGGPMGRVVPAGGFDVPLSFDGLPGMGHGGVVVLDDGVTARALALHLFRFAADESCGNCAPCRIGTGQLASRTDRVSLERLLDTLEMGSLCGFGQGVPRPIRDLLEHFPLEVLP